MNKFITLLFIVSAPLSNSCSELKEHSSETKVFYENSLRTPAEGLHRQRLLQLRGCAAFYVKNTANKVLVGTARHCMEYQPEKSCASGGSFEDYFGARGYCKEVAITNNDRDFIIFEAEFEGIIREGQTPRLASYIPGINDRIQMLGFPGDAMRAGQATLTENCWILSLPDITERDGSRVRPNFLTRLYTEFFGLPETPVFMGPTSRQGKTELGTKTLHREALLAAVLVDTESD